MEWISFEDEFPPHDETVIVADFIDGIVSLGRYDANNDQILFMNIDYQCLDSCATHWMPLPSLPE